MAAAAIARPSLGDTRRRGTEVTTFAGAAIGHRPPLGNDRARDREPPCSPGRFKNFEKHFVRNTRADVAWSALQDTLQIRRADEHVSSLPAADRLDMYTCGHRMTSS